ncbi:hypothetical protein CYMTET_33272 [Cymbomonas tetramitiformis]|uniref:Methyltransferase domain-containing protein n=1 Tax=Cymbomonas tetramitiformis TaxID=36881 RepID=A0AAE0FDC6_9CHLO|nr:hypothetical protein CYMTET_33272 [Cymbomonas tetramitiformis]|eukprot:gene8510-10105_t
MKLVFVALFGVFAAFSWSSVPSYYQLSTGVQGLRNLLRLPQSDIDNCIEAYKFFQSGRYGFGDAHEGETAAETEHVRSYYTVLHEVLAVADIEKMYIPPQIDAKQGLYVNQLLTEEQLLETLNVSSDSTLLDIGCGRGRIAHHMATMTGGKVSGFNIDEGQILNGIAYAKETGFEDRLDLKVGDHHLPFAYPDESFDGSYSFQAIWPFFKKHELDGVSREIFRVLKPGAKFSCSEYLLTPDFDHSNPHHVHLHKLFLPTLAATQSNYPKDVTDALERAGFKLVLSAPSVAPAWPITDQKTDLFLFFRGIIIGLNRIGVLPEWVEKLVNNLLLGGVAWADAEKAKIADLNWRIIVQKPF